jgi:hypothetical protein
VPTYRYGEELTGCHRGRKEIRSIPAQKGMRKFSRRNIRARLDCERFKSITKLRGWFFTRCRAVTPLAHFHVTINRNQASIGVEAEGEKEANQEERQKFLERSHIHFKVYFENPFEARNPWKIDSITK